MSRPIHRFNDCLFWSLLQQQEKRYAFSEHRQLRDLTNLVSARTKYCSISAITSDNSRDSQLKWDGGGVSSIAAAIGISDSRH